MSERVSTESVFEWPVRVYYEDTDAGGVVYYANYLKFFERARTEWLRAMGIEQDQLRDEHGLLLVVSRVAIEYQRPARFNDALVVTSRIARRSAASVEFAQAVEHPDAGTVLCQADVRIVGVDAERFRPKPFPKPIRELFT